VHQVQPSGTKVRIQTDHRLYAQFRLDEDQTIQVPGALGETTVHVQAGGVRVIASPCPGKDCMHSGKIRRSGQMIVCVPNRVVISIQGTETSALDMITQ